MVLLAKKWHMLSFVTQYLQCHRLSKILIVYRNRCQNEMFFI